MLENWLSKVNPEITSAISSLSPETIGQGIKIHKVLFPDLDDCQIILFSDNAVHMDQIRMQFYEMYNHLDNLYLADLGQLRNTDTNFLISLFTELLESKLFPIIQTNDKELLHTFHFALHSAQIAFERLHCGKNLTFFHADDYALCKQVVSMGVQGHLNPKDALRAPNIVRLADIKDAIEEAEPYTRRVDTVVLDLNIIRHSEIPGHQNASPSGLNSEELTQLFRFFGYNDNLKALFIYNYDSKYDFNFQTAQLIAQGLWYLTEARNHCITENIDSNEDFNEFLVDIDGLSEPLSFIKAKKSGRWWIKSKKDNELIPCSYKDYLTACQNEIPERLVTL